MDAKKILIVEDEILVAETIRRSLVRSGYTVVSVAVTGAEAIRAAHKYIPDAVIMDIMLKDDIDGIDAAQSICQNLGVSVVFLTAHSSHDLIGRISMSCPYVIVTKPFEEHEITEALASLLK